MEGGRGLKMEDRQDRFLGSAFSERGTEPQKKEKGLPCTEKNEKGKPTREGGD